MHPAQIEIGLTAGVNLPEDINLKFMGSNGKEGFSLTFDIDSTFAGVNFAEIEIECYATFV